MLEITGSATGGRMMLAVSVFLSQVLDAMMDAAVALAFAQGSTETSLFLRVEGYSLPCALLKP